MESLGKQGEATGEVGAGNWQFSRPTPGRQATHGAAQQGLTGSRSAREFLQPVMSAPSVLSTLCATDARDLLNLRWLTRGSAVPPPPNQHCKASSSSVKETEHLASTDQSKPPLAGKLWSLHLLWPQKTGFHLHPAVPSFPGQSSRHPYSL